ncbi:MAG: ABC transporter substrate-binding protein [Candidatus Binatia bacterium]
MNRSNFKLLITGILLLSLALISGRTSAADKLGALYSAQSVSYSMPWIAQDAGLFRKHNLDVKSVYIASSGIATAALLGGDIEIALAGAVGIVRAFAQGATDVVFIGGFKNELTHNIVARPEIMRPQDLKGKIVGVTRIGSNSHYFAVQALPRFGLDPARDVIFRQTGGDVAALAALSNGTIDAMVMLTYGQTAIAKGYHYVIYGRDLHIPYAAASVTTRRSAMARRPQVIAAYMRSLAEAAKILHTDKEYTLKILSKYLRIADRKILESSYEAELPALEQRLDIREEAIQPVLEDVAQSDPRAKNFKPQQLIDRAYLDDMVRSGFLDKLWASK